MANRRVFLLLTALFLLLAPVARATVRLPALVGSHMVLQRARALPLWGWAAPGEKVTVTFRGKTYPAAPGPNGRWQATLPPTPAGGPYTLTVKGRNTLVLADVLVGDVWLASGQSNMQFKVKDMQVKGPRGPYEPARSAEEEIAAASFPNIRLFTVSQTVAYRPQTELTGTGWRACSPATVPDFSAVAYFFGRDLYQQYKVPLGLIADSWGGTPAEAWMSAEGLRRFPEFRAQVDDFSRRTTGLADDQRAFEDQQRTFMQTLTAHDKGYLPGGKTWAAPDFDAHAWPTLNLPAALETAPSLANYDGVVWFRKEIDLTAADAGRPLTLSLGPVDDNDSTWFNGVRVGGTTGYATPRAYAVPAALVRLGRNVIVVRVVDTSGEGGITGAADALRLTTATRTVPLAGPWQYQVGIDPKDFPMPPAASSVQNSPTVLYNSMIAPLLPLAIKGVIWYQGESNAGRAEQYRTLFPALITDWRTHLGYQFPFLFVQLANFTRPLPEPAESDWAELREAQAGALRLPRTGMATAIDVGNPDNIHPHNKAEVGRRLALVARHLVYGENNLVYSGPAYVGLTSAGPAIRVKFNNARTGLVVKNGTPLRGFAVAGANRKFYWATARVEGSEVVVASDQVPDPVAVRYDWATSPVGNLYNNEGLPALPFRTDTWPGITANLK